MHGIIHLELQNFVVSKYGSDAWHTLLERAGLANQIFTPLNTYPDQQIVRLLAAAEALTGISTTNLLEAFGEFLVPRYLALYGKLLKPEWRTLDVIDSTEQTIHRVVRLREPGALPPKLRTERKSPTEVLLTYDSARKLCGIARGIARGLAKHFREGLTIEELRCMHRGDPACVFRFRIEPVG
jgi:hypothetical protein